MTRHRGRSAEEVEVHVLLLFLLDLLLLRLSGGGAATAATAAATHDHSLHGLTPSRDDLGDVLVLKGRHNRVPSRVVDLSLNRLEDLLHVLGRRRVLTGDIRQAVRSIVFHRHGKICKTGSLTTRGL